MGGIVRRLHREHRFRAGDSGWTVRVVRVWLPGDTRPRQVYQIRHGSYLAVETIDVGRVRAVLGDVLFAELEEETR